MTIMADVDNNLDKFEKDIVYLKHQQKIHIFPVDSVYAEEVTAFQQESEVDRDIYDSHLNQKVNKLMAEPANLWVFTGGQTFSGKEECMFGDRLKGSIIFSALQSIFLFIEQDETRDFILRISWFEIYNDETYDLLAISSNHSKLKVKSQDKVLEEVWSSLHEIIALWNLSLNNINNLNKLRRSEMQSSKNISSLNVRHPF